MPLPVPKSGRTDVPLPVRFAGLIQPKSWSLAAVKWSTAPIFFGAIPLLALSVKLGVPQRLRVRYDWKVLAHLERFGATRMLLTGFVPLGGGVVAEVSSREVMHRHELGFYQAVAKSAPRTPFGTARVPRYSPDEFMGSSRKETPKKVPPPPAAAPPPPPPGAPPPPLGAIGRPSRGGSALFDKNPDGTIKLGALKKTSKDPLKRAPPEEREDGTFDLQAALRGSRLFAGVQEACRGSPARPAGQEEDDWTTDPNHGFLPTQPGVRLPDAMPGRSDSGDSTSSNAGFESGSTDSSVPPETTSSIGVASRRTGRGRGRSGRSRGRGGRGTPPRLNASSLGRGRGGPIPSTDSIPPSHPQSLSESSSTAPPDDQVVHKSASVADLAAQFGGRGQPAGVPPKGHSQSMSNLPKPNPSATVVGRETVAERRRRFEELAKRGK